MTISLVSLTDVLNREIVYTGRHVATVQVQLSCLQICHIDHVGVK